MKPYEDFDLLVEKSGQRYKVWVRSAVGEAEGTFRLPVPFAEVEALLAALGEGPAAGSHVHGRSGYLSTRKLAESVGGRMYRAVFAGGVGARFAAGLQHAAARGAGLRIRLDLGRAPELARWPWELLYDRDLSHFPAVAAATPIVRRLSLPLSTPLLRVRPPLSVLLVAALPVGQDRLSAQPEIDRIEKVLAPLVEAGKVVIDRLRSPTLEALSRRLGETPVHVLHFIGHGRYDSAHGEGVLLFEDERRRPLEVDGHRLGAMLFDRGLRLVVLNACEGARHGETDAFDGVAQTLLQKNIPAVVAMQLVIPDRAAVTFAESFYHALAEGHPIDAAVADARLALWAKHRQFRWVAPVLYLRSPDGVLFDREGTAAESAPRSHLRRIAPWLSIAAAALLVLGIALFVRWHNNAQQLARKPAAARLLPLALAPSQPIARTAPVVAEAPAAKPKPAVQPPSFPPAPECMLPEIPDASEILFFPIKAGTFWMGSDHPKRQELPLHQVTLSHDFCMGAYEITEGQWDAVMGDGKALSTRERLLPKVSVTRAMVDRFIDRLGELNRSRHVFLPTEAQWEYAGRAGSQARYSFGDDPGELHRYANCLGNEGHEGGFNGRAPIGKLAPNRWRLFDMQGNVSEWVADFDGDVDSSAITDPKGPASGDHYVIRGGSYKNVASSCTMSYRAALPLSFSRNDIGFRIAMDPVH